MLKSHLKRSPQHLGLFPGMTQPLDGPIELLSWHFPWQS